jgi:hypothetical protein
MAIPSRVLVEPLPVMIQFFMVLLVQLVVAVLVSSMTELDVFVLVFFMVSDGVVAAPMAPFIVTPLVDASFRIEVVLVPEMVAVTVGCIVIAV